jgi:PAS domain S-box-containing protein
VGVAAKQFAESNERSKSQLIFEDHLHKQVFLLEKRIGAFVEILSALKSFFESSDFVTREEFSSFTKDSLARYPTIKALEWIPMVPDEWRQVHEERTRKTEFEQYSITVLSADGSLTPAPRKNVYFPVYYLEPLPGNRPALGYDLSSEKIRSQAILSSIEQSEAVLSDPVDLVQAKGKNTGILLFMRVVPSSAPGGEFNEGSCQGLVLLVLNLDEVIKSTLLTDAFLNGSSYAFELVDINFGGTTRVLFSHPGTPEEEECKWEVDLTIETGGQVWNLTAKPLPPFLAKHAGINPVIIGFGTATIWELIWISLIASANWSKTSVINRQNRILDSVLLSMAEGVVVADAEGRVILTNHAAALLIGGGEEMQSDGVKALISLCKLPDKKSPIPYGEFPLTKAIEGNQVRDKIFWVPAPNPSARGAWVSANAAPLLSPNGTQHGGILVLRDITNRKQALEFSERMNNAVELTDDSVFITDQSGVIQYINAAFTKSTGFSGEEALGKTPRILKSSLNPPEHYKELWSTILGGRVFRKMVINRKKSGDIYYADQTITPMRDLSGRITHFVSVVKDMTEYRLMRQREVEMEIAVKVQKSLFPSDPPPVEYLDMAGAVFSADATCGDYFDYIPMLGNRVCLVVGDVSGHGIGPALVMAETRAYVRSLSPDDNSPGEILSRVNRILVEDLKGDHFVTLILAYVDADSGRLVYSSAGHDTCFLIDHTGHIKHELHSTGMPLGMFELGDYPTSQEIGFQKGDILFLMTDGLSDCQADQDRFLDIQGCLSLIHRHRNEPAKVIIKKIFEHARNFMGEEPQTDDITMLICKAVPGQNPISHYPENPNPPFMSSDST